MPPTEDFRTTLKELIYIYALWDIPARFVNFVKKTSVLT